MKRKRELMPRSETFEGSELAVEKCRNPWNGTCGNTDIALYIFYEGSRLPICRNCWNDLAVKNIEWSYDQWSFWFLLLSLEDNPNGRGML